MDRVYNLEEITDSIWASSSLEENAGELSGSPSEWVFQAFLHDEASPSFPSFSSREINNGDRRGGGGDMSSVSGNVFRSKMTAPTLPPIDSAGYEAVLKQRLDLACAAVAMARASGVKLHVTPLADNGHQSSQRSELFSHSSSKGPSRIEVKSAGSPAEVPAIPVIEKILDAHVKAAGSGSSKDQSDDDDDDDDDLEGESEMSGQMDAADAKRMRRMLSNRESARRSRRRKQAHLSELEAQVAQLKIENSSLLKRFTDISQKCSVAAVDNRILKADVETLRTKVKMAEGAVKRVTGMGHFFQTGTAVSVVPGNEVAKHFFPTAHASQQSNGILDVNHGPDKVNGSIGNAGCSE